MAVLYGKAGGGNVNGANWSTTGSGGVDSVTPTVGDDLILETGSGAFTVNSGSTCRSLNCTSGTGDYGNVLTHTAAVTFTIGDGTAGAGSVALKFSAGMTYTLGSTTTSQITFASTSGTAQDIDFAAKSSGNVSFGTAGSWKVTGAWNTGAVTTTITHTSGTLNTNGQACSWGAYASSGAVTRVLTLGGSTITITGVGSSWSITGSGDTLNANTSTIASTGAGFTFTGGSRTYNNLTATPVGSTFTFNGNDTLNNVTITAGASIPTVVQMSGNIVVNGVYTVTGNSAGVNRVIVQSNTVGTSRTITVNGSHGAHANVDFMDITFDGTAGALTGTSIGNALGNSNITFTTPVTRYAVSAGAWGTTVGWSTSDGGGSGASVPICHDNVILTSNSGVGTITTSVARPCADLTVSGYTGTLSNNVNCSIYGNLTLDDTMAAMSGGNGISLRGRGIHTITTDGEAQNNSLAMRCPGGVYSFTDNYTSTTGITRENGTMTATTQNISIQGMTSTVSTARALNMGSGTWTMTGTGNAWNQAGTSDTLDAQTSTIHFSDAGASSKTFTSGGKTYNKFTCATGGAGAIIFIGSPSYAKMSAVGGGTKTIQFTAGITVTLTGAADSFFSGAFNNLITIQSTSGGSAWTLSKTSGDVISNYISLQDSTATGGAKFYATNSVSVSGNTGWNFNTLPSRAVATFRQAVLT